MTVSVYYADAFKRQLRRFSRKYRHIRTDIEPLVKALSAGETPGDQVQHASHTVYKVRVRTLMPGAENAVAIV